MTLARLKVAEYELKWSGGDAAEHSLTVGIGGEADLAIPGAAVWTALTKIVDLTAGFAHGPRRDAFAPPRPTNASSGSRGHGRFRIQKNTLHCIGSAESPVFG